MLKRYNSLKLFIEEVKKEGGSFNSIYKRNFRAALKSIIPIAGNFIDANIFETIENRKLDEILTALSVKCEQALELKNEIESRNELFEKINGLFDVLLVRHHEIIVSNQEILKSNQKDIIATLKILSNSIVSPPETEDSGCVARNEDFILFLISGPSAVGKDVILSHLHSQHFPKFNNVETLKKFSTRTKRVGEHLYHRIVDKVKFDELLSEKMVLFHYVKHHNSHGFDRDHLNLTSCSPNTTLMFAIHTEYTKIEQTKNFLKAQGINSVSILLEADQKDLLYRTEFRNFEPETVTQRRHAIRRDCNYIELNSHYIDSAFDGRFMNGNDKAVNDTVQEIVAFINNDFCFLNDS